MSASTLGLAVGVWVTSHTTGRSGVISKVISDARGLRYYVEWFGESHVSLVEASDLRLVRGAIPPR